MVLVTLHGLLLHGELVLSSETLSGLFSALNSERWRSARILRNIAKMTAACYTRSALNFSVGDILCYMVPEVATAGDWGGGSLARMLSVAGSVR